MKIFVKETLLILAFIFAVVGILSLAFWDSGIMYGFFMISSIISSWFYIVLENLKNQKKRERRQNYGFNS